MQEDARIEKPPGIDSRPMEETANLEIPTKPIPTQTYMPHIPYPEAAKQPTKLHECIGTDMFEGSIEKAKTYKEKKTFCGNQIPHRQIRPVHKLWAAFGTNLI
ncbi:unnamed protein product [Malus baccata var. baccata]